MPSPVPEVLEERFDEEEEYFLGGDESRSSGCKEGNPADILDEDPFLALLEGVGRSSLSSAAIDPSSSDEDICLDFLDLSSLDDVLARESDRGFEVLLLLRLLDGAFV